MHCYEDTVALDAALPHTRARAPYRQFEIAECRCKLLLQILCSVARAVQAVLQQPAHVFVTCLVIFWRQFDEYSSSWWSVEIRPSPVNQCHTCSSTFTRGNLRQHYFQRLQRLRRRVQLWPCVCLVFLRDPPRTSGFPDCPLSVSAHPVLMSAFSVSRRHTSLETLVHIFWRQNTLHLFTSCLGAQPRVKPPAIVFTPMPPVPQAEQFVLIVVHWFLPFSLARDLFLCFQ